MIKLNQSVMKKITLGMTLGIVTSVVMLLITQSVLISQYIDGGDSDLVEDTSEVPAISPEDWDFTTSNSFTSVLLSDQREENMISYVFAMGEFRDNSGNLVIQSLPFYGERTLIYAVPVYDEYPHVVTIGNESDFNIEMDINPTNSTDIAVDSSDFSSVNAGLAQAISSSEEGIEMDETELEQFRIDYRKPNNTVLIFAHIYADGSILNFEMINSEVIHIQFIAATYLYYFEGGFDWYEGESSHYLFDLESFDEDVYINSVIDMVDLVEGY